MLDYVERSLISIKHRLQHRPTFLLFSGVNNDVDSFGCSTFFDTRMSTKLTLRVSVSMAMIYFYYNVFVSRVAA